MGFIREAVKRCSPSFEFLSGTGTLFRQSWTAPAAAANTGILAATTCPTAGTTLVTAGITNPDFPRNLRIKGNQASVTGNVVVKGFDQFGNAATDTIAASGVSAVDGTIAFKSITSIQIPTRGAGGDTISLGPATALGLSRHISDAGGATVSASVDGSREATLPTLSSSKHTAIFNTAPNAAHNYVLYFMHEDISNG